MSKRPRSRPLSRNTLLGRVHEQASLEERHDVEGLYRLIDPMARLRLEREPGDEPERIRSALREVVRSVGTVRVEEVEIVDATRTSARHGGRPAAVVRSIVRYDRDPEPRQRRATWVRDEGVWYTTEIATRPPA
jgi:hypothetical protein